jgi:hypothetical protein
VGSEYSLWTGSDSTLDERLAPSYDSVVGQSPAIGNSFGRFVAIASSEKRDVQFLIADRTYWLRRPAGEDPSCGLSLPAETIGPFTQDELVRLVYRSGRYNGDCFYRNGARSRWIRLRLFGELEFGENTSDRIDRMRSADIKWVKWLTARNGLDCEACAALDEKIFPIEAPPIVPPSNCRCDPWCKCVLIAVDKP